MKLAIVGSRSVAVDDLGKYIPDGVSEIVSGGAKGIDTCAANYARAAGLKLTEFLPDYDSYGRGAPLRRNDQIAAYADEVLALWDGESHGTAYTIKKFEKLGKPTRVIILKPNDE